MINEFNGINWHDSKILSVIEDCEGDRILLRMDMDVSDARDGTSYAKKGVIFFDASCFSVDEGPVFGCPVILDAIITEAVMNGRSMYLAAFETNAGCRKIYFSKFTIEDSAQQGDAPEPATNANPASRPLPSPAR